MRQVAGIAVALALATAVLASALVSSPRHGDPRTVDHSQAEARLGHASPEGPLPPDRLHGRGNIRPARSPLSPKPLTKED